MGEKLQNLSAAKLIRIQRKINAHFVYLRDRGGLVAGIYGRLQYVESELNRRKIVW